jgi:nicotinamidase-related amidase
LSQPAAALLLVDLQRGAFDGLRCAPMPAGDALIATCQRWLAGARARGDRVVWVQHAAEPGGAMDPAGPGFAIDPRLSPLAEEPRVVKTQPSAFDGTGLASLLTGVDVVHVVGLQSDECVLATAMAGHALGLPIAVVGDAHHSWPSGGVSAEAVRDGVNERLRVAGVRVV